MINCMNNNRPATETFEGKTLIEQQHFSSSTTNSTHFNMEGQNISPPSPAAIRVMCQQDSKTRAHSPVSSSSSHHDSDSSFSPASSSNSSSSTANHSTRKNSITSISKSNKTRKNSLPKKHAKITSSSTHKSKYTPDSKKKSKIKIPIFELIRVMALPQSTAANCLGVSLSTLKRRYYELGIGRWPGQVNVTKDIDLDVPTSEKSKLSYLLNEENLDSAKDLDQVTLSILNFTFKQTF